MPSTCRRCPLASSSGIPHSLASPAGVQMLRPRKSVYGPARSRFSTTKVDASSHDIWSRPVPDCQTQGVVPGLRPVLEEPTASATRSIFSVAGDRGSYLEAGTPLTAQSSVLCSATSPGEPQMLAVCAVLSVFEWLRSCCKFGVCCRLSPRFSVACHWAKGLCLPGQVGCGGDGTSPSGSGSAAARVRGSLGRPCQSPRHALSP